MCTTACSCGIEFYNNFLTCNHNGVTISNSFQQSHLSRQRQSSHRHRFSRFAKYVAHITVTSHLKLHVSNHLYGFCLKVSFVILEGCNFRDTKVHMSPSRSLVCYYTIKLFAKFCELGVRIIASFTKIMNQMTKVSKNSKE